MTMNGSRRSCPFALTIAGSDPSGGAGIQMDIRTFAACGVFGLSAITVLTIQNSASVMECSGVGADLVARQIQALLSDIPVAAIKTGLLWDHETAVAVCDLVPVETPLVIDPVFVSSTGQSLFSGQGDDLIGAYEHHVIPRAAIFTPNRQEAEVILNHPVRSLADIDEAAADFLSMGAGAVIMKGGHHHDSREIHDFFYTREGCVEGVSPRYPCDPHGTGCCFSASLTAWLARGSDPKRAFLKAKTCVDHAIRNAVQAPSGRYLLMPEAMKDGNSDEY